MATGDRSKTLRHFYCRDAHWETCERMASDFDCSIDYIINEAMRYYAWSRNYRSAEAAKGTPSPPIPTPEAAGTLFLIFEGQRYPIAKEQFTIGRGAKNSDLPIKDSNISRTHAAVIRQHGTFYIRDLGSTNGICFNGMRIDNKRIDEGDTFYVCDYELRFTYR